MKQTKIKIIFESEDSTFPPDPKVAVVNVTATFDMFEEPGILTVGSLEFDKGYGTYLPDILTVTKAVKR